MTNYQDLLSILQHNLGLLRKAETKCGSNVPLELRNQLADYQEAIALIEQVNRGELNEVNFQQSIQPLLAAIRARTSKAGSNISTGKMSEVDSGSVGQDASQLTAKVVMLLSQALINREEGLTRGVQAMLALVLKQVGAVDSRTAQKYPGNPSGYQTPLSDALTELLEADRGLVARLEALLTQHEATAGYQATVIGSGASAQGEGAQAVGESGVLVDGSVTGNIVIAREGAKVYIGEAPVAMPAVDRESALGRYLQHLISRNRYLQLQGIRSGGRLVNIELDQIYVTLRATRQRVVTAEEAWLTREATLAPGEGQRLSRETTTETVTVNVNEALAASQRLVVLGDPGSGKTTLLRYLALLYARDLAEQGALVPDKLALSESGWLPILLPLRQIGTFLRTRPNDGTEGHILLLEFLLQSLKNERIPLPENFFDEWLNSGRAVILLDGLDEVADPDLRRRVSRLVEAFTRAYAECRYVVTSRIVGYSGPARLGEGYATTTVRDFTLADVERFLSNWHRLVAIGQMGPGTSAEAYAADQTRQLLQAIEANERVRELAINPLLLTVIAIVHRDRVKLPDRRAELYAEAIDVLLGKWEEAKGVTEVAILDGKPFDAGDKRLILQHLALHIHEQKQKEIAADDLRRWLGERFYEVVGNWREVGRVVSRFLDVIEERTGLLAVRGEGVYAFSHLTFQEYLAAVGAIERDDYLSYLTKRIAEPWWREVILLAVGYLSTKSREKTTRLIQTIANLKKEPAPYHNLVLAAECLRHVGSNRMQGDLLGRVQHQLRKELETRSRKDWWGSVQSFVLWRMSPKALTERRIAAAIALARIGGESYWSLPFGEPDWINIPAGPFRTSKDSTAHQVEMAAYAIARVPITNAQYQLFVQATDYRIPRHWEEGRPPKGKESHPVVYISWNDALAYCQWLSRMIGKKITLPSEAEWARAVRGDKDEQNFPWGDTFDSTRCNTSELTLGDTTPVGIFPNGASPYGCLDMAGNVWEWCIDWYDESRTARVVRGGSFDDIGDLARCASRRGNSPFFRYDGLGFRVVMSPIL